MNRWSDDKIPRFSAKGDVVIHHIGQVAVVVNWQDVADGGLFLDMPQDAVDKSHMAFHGSMVTGSSLWLNSEPEERWS